MTQTELEAAIETGRTLMGRRKPIEAIRSLQLARFLNGEGGSRALSIETEHLLGICWRMASDLMARPSGILGALDEASMYYALRSEWLETSVLRSQTREGLRELGLKASGECFERAYEQHEKTPANERDLAFFLKKAGILRDQSALNLSRGDIEAAHQNVLEAIGVLSGAKRSSRVKDDEGRLPLDVSITRAFELYVCNHRPGVTSSQHHIITMGLGWCYKELLGKHNIWALNAGMRWLKVASLGQRPAIARKLLKLAIFDNEARSSKRVVEITALVLGFDRLV